MARKLSILFVGEHLWTCLCVMCQIFSVNCLPPLFLMVVVEIIFWYIKLWANILSDRFYFLQLSLMIFPSLLVDGIASLSYYSTTSYKNGSYYSFCLFLPLCPIPHHSFLLSSHSLSPVLRSVDYYLPLISQSLLFQALFPPLFLFSLSQPHLQLCWLLSHCLQACFCIF